MANRDYMDEYRKSHPEYRERQNKLNAAKQAADRRLREQYRLEWTTMYQEECKARGIDAKR